MTFTLNITRASASKTEGKVSPNENEKHAHVTSGTDLASILQRNDQKSTVSARVANEEESCILQAAPSSLESVKKELASDSTAKVVRTYSRKHSRRITKMSTTDGEWDTSLSHKDNASTESSSLAASNDTFCIMQRYVLTRNIYLDV